MLVIETGASVVGANSFIDVGELDAVRAGLFSAEAAGVDGEAALRRAFLYMKSLGWSKASGFPLFDGAVPEDVKTAQAIFAHYEVLSPESLQPNIVPGQQKVLNKVDGIGWKVTGSSGVQSQKAQASMALDLLGPFLSGGGGNVKFYERA